ncbi:hypothetical protein BGZ98_001352 [Dissophora globulifera]|nr:hypothetical protein BGZ98_001352 [Dissophora globulifera]
MAAPRVVATLRCQSSGQTLSLANVQIVSQKTSNDITITRLGTNRSWLDGEELVKNTPVVLTKSGVLTLLEHDFPVAITILPQEIPEDKPIAIKQESTTQNPSTRVSEPPAQQPHTYQLRKNMAVPPQALASRLIQKDRLHKSASGDVSEATSDSDDDNAKRTQQSSSEMSEESSIICSDLSDLDSERDCQQGADSKGHTLAGEKAIHLLD